MAQSPNQAVTSSGAVPTTPRLIRFSGSIAQASGTVGATFALYKDQNGGAPLWLETQNVVVNSSGRYTVFLGANHADGVPLEMFTSGEARWLGVQAEGQPEQPRVLLVSVPYALKAADADTLAGQPAASYVRTETLKQEVTAAFKADNTQSNPTLLAIVPSGTVSTNALASGATTFTDTTADQVVGVTQNGTGKAISASSNSNNPTIYAVNNATSGASAFGVRGLSYSTTGGSAGVRGEALGTTAPNIGIWGVSNGLGGTGILGEANGSGTTYGLRGKSTTSTTGVGLMGDAQATSGNTIGAWGRVFSPAGTALRVEALTALTTGKLFRAINAGAEKFSIDGTGNVSAAGDVTLAAGKKFIGDGSSLTAVNASTLGGNAVAYYAPATGGNYVAKSGDVMTGNLEAPFLLSDGDITAMSSVNGSWAYFSNTGPGYYGMTVSAGGTGATTGVASSVNSTTGIAGSFANGAATGKALRASVGGTERFRVDETGAVVTGKVTASSFNLNILTFAGQIGSIAGGPSAAFVFAGPTATVTTTAGQRITGSAMLPIATSSGATTAEIDLCFQPSGGGTITNFVQGNYSIAEISTTRVSHAVAASAVAGAGTWRIGACVLNDGSTAIDDNDYVNGWVMVTN